MNLSSHIEATAADWLARRDGGDWGTHDDAALEAWLAAATAHRVAYLRLAAAWQQAGRLKALGAGVPGGTIPQPGALELRPYFEGPRVQAVVPSNRAVRFRLAAAAAAFVAAIGAGWFYWPIEQNTYRTAIGAVTTVSIPDGSTVTLNTDSEIQVAVTDTERRVNLNQGEAYFEVARDPNRPFVVRAGQQRVVVLGTKFSVRRMAGDLRVVVTEGKVRVEPAGGAPEAPAAELLAGTVARMAGGGTLIEREELSDAADALSWRSGYLVFRDTTLEEAVAEFNRYNVRKIVIEDPALASIRIGGNFRSTNVDAFVRLLEHGFRIRATPGDDQIVLTSG